MSEGLSDKATPQNNGNTKITVTPVCSVEDVDNLDQSPTIALGQATALSPTAKTSQFFARRRTHDN